MAIAIVQTICNQDVFVWISNSFWQNDSQLSIIKWLVFRISDPIWNPDYLQPHLVSTIQNPDLVQILDPYFEII